MTTSLPDADADRDVERLRAERPEQNPWARRAPIVLVPLDGSAAAATALPLARHAAQIARASVHIVHASDRELGHEELLERTGLSRESAHDAILHTVVGEPAEAISRLARESNAMLIALATHGDSTQYGRVLGQTAELIVQQAPCPVVLVRPEIGGPALAELALRRILLPLDGAPSSAAAIAPALELARRSQARVDFLYVAMSAKGPDELGSLTAPLYVDQSQHEWPAWAQEFISRFGSAIGQALPLTSTRLFLRPGEPAVEILRFADEQKPDLIVLEWRGDQDLAQEQGPSHSRVVWSVLSSAPCPVLLFHVHPELLGVRAA